MASTPPKPTAKCAGDTCTSRATWPLHHVRHRGELRRLCTSCVLKYHPGSFCCLCFLLLDPPSSPNTVHCSKCPSVCHVSCLLNPSFFTCPCCDHGSDTFTFFSPHRIGFSEAKVLNAAATLATRSMERAALAARAEAERKAKEATVAKKRAREMLETAITIGMKEKESNLASEVEAQPQKKKAVTVPAAPPAGTGKVEAGAGAVRRTNTREVDKWLRLHEMAIHSGDGKSVGKVGSLKEGVSCAVVSVSVDKGKKGATLVVPAKEEKPAVVAVDHEKGSRKPMSSQGSF